MIKFYIKILLIFIIPLTTKAAIKCKIITPGTDPVKASCNIGKRSDQTVFMSKSYIPKVFRENGSSNLALAM
jgi:hypothetical protein